MSDTVYVKVRIFKNKSGKWEARVRTHWWKHQLRREFDSYEAALDGATAVVAELVEKYK